MTVQTRENMRLRAITRRLEHMKPERILAKIQAGEVATGMWGTAPTGKPHIGYLVPLIKVAECIASGIPVRILIADSYAYLMNHDVPMETVEHRSRYYRFLVTAVLRALGVAPSEIDVVRESSYSMGAEFCREKMRMCAVSNEEEVRAVGLEVADASMMGPLVCPIHQALSDVYMGTDFQLGGLDQRGVFEYAEKCLPRIGRKPASYVMAPMVPGLKSGKMSSSGAADTKIMFCDPEDAVNAKVAGADLPAGEDPSGNGIMAMFEHIVFPFHELSPSAPPVEIPLAGGEGPRRYPTYEDLKADVVVGAVHPEDLRGVFAAELNRIIGPVREEHAASSEWRLVEERAYHKPSSAGVGM